MITKSNTKFLYVITLTCAISPRVPLRSDRIKTIVFHYMYKLSFTSWGEWKRDACLMGKELFTFIELLIKCVTLMDTFQYNKNGISLHETWNKTCFRITQYSSPD